MTTWRRSEEPGKAEYAPVGEAAQVRSLRGRTGLLCEPRGCEITRTGSYARAAEEQTPPLPAVLSRPRSGALAAAGGKPAPLMHRLTASSFGRDDRR
jgi:hypothetical protein